jgi:glucokinase
MNNTFKYAIGIDLGGTFIKFGLVRSDGQLMYESILPTEANKTASAVIANLISAVKQAQEYAQEQGVVPFGIGIGTPGVIDRTYRVVLEANNIVGWKNLNLADSIEQVCGLPVWINNDASMMGLGEQAFGAARNYSDVLFLSVGTGIGGAIIINNKLFGGYDNRGAELGHTPLYSDGVSCSCGNIGCLEAYASTTALIQQFENRCMIAGIGFSEKITGKLIVKLYQEQHPIAVESINVHCRFLGRGIAGLVNIFSPQRVVLGGGISESGSFYIDNIKAEMSRYVVASCAVNTDVCAAQLGNKAGILGAAQWAFLCSNE